MNVDKNIKYERLKSLKKNSELGTLFSIIFSVSTLIVLATQFQTFLSASIDPQVLW